MIDTIVGYDDSFDTPVPIYKSDLCQWYDYIGYEDEKTHEVILYS